MSDNWRVMVQKEISRRSFMRGLGVFGAGIATSTLVPQAVTETAAPIVHDAKSSYQTMASIPFAPIEPSTADELRVPEGFNVQVLIKQGDIFTPDGKSFGDNADWTGWYPIDGLEGGNSTEEGLLVVNNEFFNSLLLNGYTGVGSKTPEQIQAEKEAVGFAVIHIRKANGQWQVVSDSPYARRFDASTPIIFSGPVAGAEVVAGATEVIGTLANCSGGQTPWKTGLSCEENYQSYYGEDSIHEVNLANTYGWLVVPVTSERPEHYGWVVEIDPYSGIAKKRTAMGRFRHENVTIGIGASGKVVAYMGDDARDQCVYKFVSARAYDPNNREANFDLLDEGTLYVANFGSGGWIPLVWEGNEAILGDPNRVGGYTIRSQADVLTYASQCALALGATKTDRPEDIEIHPLTGDIYIAFNNNSNHGNFHGQIARIKETNGDFESTTFAWDIFAVGGPQAGWSSPDNMIFDSKGNLWMVTDVSGGSLNSGIYEFMGNNSLFMLPTEGENSGKAYLFATGPVQCELTGPTWIGNDTLILSVQHPGEESESLDALTSHFPEGGDAKPKASVVVITGAFDA